MEGIFKELENENALRSYPFAAGCSPDIPAGVFVDAMLYPVNPRGILYLSGISESGVFSVSDDSGVVMKGSASGSSVEMFDVSGLSRHVGTIVASSEEALAEFSGRGVAQEFGREEAAFASGCVCPVVVDGVSSVSVGGTGPITGTVDFSNKASDPIRVSSGLADDGRRTLRFDILPRPSPPDMRSIKRIICVVDGQTPFRIGKTEGGPYNIVVLTLAGIDREAVCAAAHRENEFEMADTCECRRTVPQEEPIPETYQLEEVTIPPTDLRPFGASNAFFLVVPNLAGYVNPLSITLEDGAVVPKTDDIKVVVEGNSASLADGEMLDSVSSKCVVIQVPGLSGGEI